MKKFYFDCGTHMFQGFLEFCAKYNIDSSWYCYCFEPNKLTYNESKKVYEVLEKKYNIEHLNKGISNEDEYVKIKCAKVRTWGHGTQIGSYTDQSSNILEKSQDWWNDDYEEYDVEVIDFSSFLKKTVTIDDYVIIKMDIEGSEFAVLDKLIQDNTIDFINDLYVEFHERNFDDQDLYFQKKKEYIKLFEDKNINFFEWI
jgi:FkbM family methyltransferase